MSTTELPSAQRQWLVKVAGISGYFANKSGGEVTADTSKVWDGGARMPQTMAGPASASDVTVSRPYKRSRDAALVKRLRQQVGKLRATLSITPTDADLVPFDSGDEVYPNALLKGVSPSEVDAASSDASTFELTFGIDDFE